MSNSYAMADYEAPVYVPFNRNHTWNTAAGHVSSCLYTYNDLQHKVYEVLPEAEREVSLFPHATVAYMTEKFVTLVNDIQLHYQFYVNRMTYIYMTEPQLRGLKNAGSSMRVQAVARQAQEQFHPLTYDIITSHHKAGDTATIDAWVEEIKQTATKMLIDIAEVFFKTVSELPTPPEGAYAGEDTQIFQEQSIENNYNDNEYVEPESVPSDVF